MKLEYIRLKNFRQFFGEQESEFSRSDERNVTVFHGDNGAGKTSLFTAINWCLYGAAADNIGELVSKEALARAADGDTLTTQVAVGFINEATRFLATRTLSARKTGLTTIHTGTEFTLSRMKASGDTDLLNPPKYYMNLLLPENVRPYFFFDGEKMDDLTRAKNTEVKEAIRNIMRLPAIEKAQEHLSEIAAEYRRLIKGQGSTEVQKLTEEEEKNRANKAKALLRLEEVKTEIESARQQREDLEEKLRGLRGAQQLQKRRDDTQAQLQLLERREQNTLAEIQRLANRAYLQLLSEPARKSLEILDKKRERGEVPSGIREQLVKDLLHAQTCLCGRSFEEHDAAYQKLSSLLKSSTTNQMASEVTKVAGNIRALSTLASEQARSLAHQMQTHIDLKISLDGLYTQLEHIKEELRGMPQENIGGLEKMRGEFQRKYEMALTEHGKIKSDLNTYDKLIAYFAQQKEAAQAKEQKLASLAKSEHLAQKGADAVTVLKDEFFEETRAEVERTTRAVFERLAWKQEHFQGVNIDSEFRLEVIDRWGTPTRQELSAGERQVLSLSFICAMAEVSGEEAPLVMDTPFGRLGGSHLAAIAENLPNLTPQLVLFVTDREWDESARTGLVPRTGRQYRLNFDKSTGCTTIEEVG